MAKHVLKKCPSLQPVEGLDLAFQLNNTGVDSNTPKKARTLPSQADSKFIATHITHYLVIYLLALPAHQIILHVIGLQGQTKAVGVKLHSYSTLNTCRLRPLLPGLHRWILLLLASLSIHSPL